jgi:hypothetical protein
MVKQMTLFSFLLFAISACKIVAPVHDVAIITKVSYAQDVMTSRGYPFSYGYVVNNRRYDRRDAAYSNVMKGETFELIYDSLHPGRSSIHLTKPVFNPWDSVSFTVGTIIDVDDRSVGKRVFFEYFLNGRTFKKQQQLDASKPCNKGGSYKVGYLREFPQISILYIDEPK